jgi:ADP-heptose:LPS heptosyltransferase
MHIAAAQGTPVLALLGPTDPRRTGPYGQLGNVMSGECELKPCLKRHCPGMGQKCLRDLSPLSVAARAKKLLDEAMVGTRLQP